MNSTDFEDLWSVLISRTNWEKGKIVSQWAESNPDLTPGIGVHEEFARLVGGVTGHNISRLRLVYERFGDERANYKSLRWNHFLAAIEWDDAAEWLQLADENRWSVSQMRKRRWEKQSC